MKKYYSYSNYGIELLLTMEQAKRGYHSGQCEKDVIELMPELKEQLDNIKPETLRKELREHGAWNEKELQNHKENLLRWVWIACGDIVDNPIEE
jgi:hypothetical protein